MCVAARQRNPEVLTNIIFMGYVSPFLTFPLYPWLSIAGNCACVLAGYRRFQTSQGLDLLYSTESFNLCKSLNILYLNIFNQFNCFRCLSRVQKHGETERTIVTVFGTWNWHSSCRKQSANSKKYSIRKRERQVTNTIISTCLFIFYLWQVLIKRNKIE